MTVLSYQTLVKIKPVRPFEDRNVRSGLTYGVGPCGYDIRIAEDVTLFFGKHFALASSLEYFNMPNDVCARVQDKSSLARAGIFVQNTFIEPGWRGWLTLEISYAKYFPFKIKKGDPIAQIIFEFLDEATHRPYKGKYQDQKAGPQLPLFNDKK